MDDGEVITAFLEGGSAAVFGPSLHVERATLMFDGWWALAHRVSDRTVIVRDEDTPAETTAPAEIAAALTVVGLRAVGADLPAVTMLTLTNLDLGYAPWMVWSTDLASGEEDLNAKVTEEAFLQGGSVFGAPIEIDNSDLARGARRLAGAPSRILVTVGVGGDRTAVLREGLEDCQLDCRGFDQIEPGQCASLLPTLVLVDATGPDGSRFLDQLRVDRPGPAPVVAITTGAEMREGADATVDGGEPPAAWLPLIQALLR